MPSLHAKTKACSSTTAAKSVAATLGSGLSNSGPKVEVPQDLLLQMIAAVNASAKSAQGQCLTVPSDETEDVTSKPKSFAKTRKARTQWTDDITLHPEVLAGHLKLKDDGSGKVLNCLYS